MLHAIYPKLILFWSALGGYPRCKYSLNKPLNRDDSSSFLSEISLKFIFKGKLEIKTSVLANVTEILKAKVTAISLEEVRVTKLNVSLFLSKTDYTYRVAWYFYHNLLFFGLHQCEKMRICLRW